MKVLAICGSPRKGNTYRSLKEMEETNPEVNLKIIMLKDVDLKNCLGCYSCINLGQEKCPLKDDRDMLIEEMENADGVIFASPTYSRAITSLMKNFMDRLAFYPHRPHFFGKYAMVMATYGGFGADMVNDYMEGNIGQFGFDVVSKLELQFGSKSEGETRDNSKRIATAMEELKKAIKEKPKKKPTFSELVYFHIFKAISEWNKEAGKADYKFYKDKKDYYIDIKINPIKNSLAKWIAGKEISKMKASG
jgi:multimeric flavodoxin WrbA